MNFPKKIEEFFAEKKRKIRLVFKELDAVDLDILQLQVLAVYAEDQKEDQEIRGNLAKTCTDLNDKILRLELEEKERKQKLQQFLLVDLPLMIQHYDSVLSQSDKAEAWEKMRIKIKELLKE